MSDYSTAVFLFSFIFFPFFIGRMRGTVGFAHWIAWATRRYRYKASDNLSCRQAPRLSRHGGGAAAHALVGGGRSLMGCVSSNWRPPISSSGLRQSIPAPITRPTSSPSRPPPTGRWLSMAKMAEAPAGITADQIGSGQRSVGNGRVGSGVRLIWGE